MAIRFHATLAELFAGGRPADHPIARHADGSYTVWATFVARIAERRAKLAHADDDRILVADADALDFLVHLLATLDAGLTPVIPPNFLPATLAEFAAALPDMPAPDGQALELYTSGSSGQPKRIGKTVVQLERECAVLERLWGHASAGALTVATVPHHHIYGLLFRLFWPLLAGRPFDTVIATEPATLRQRLHTAAPCLLVSSPAQLSRLHELTDLAAMPRPGLLFSSGGPLAASDAQRIADEWQVPPTEVFGSSESGGIAWRRQSDDGAVWTPFPGIAIARDADGALLLTSPFLADDRPLRLEDSVELLAAGRFRLGARLDRTLKVEEKRLSLPDMEARLGAHPAVAAAALVPLQRGRRLQLGAVVVPHAGCTGDKALAGELRRHLAAYFDAVLLPRRWRFASALPYNERGKLPQAELAALFEKSPT